MRRAPYVIAGAIVIAAAAIAIHLAEPPEPFASDAGLAIGLGVLLFAVITAAGLLLARGRWARWLATGVVVANAALFVATDASVASIVAVSAAAFGAVGLAGPWLDGWLRKLPSSKGPGWRPMAAVLGALALVPIVGVASPSGLTISHGVLGAAGFLLAWFYSRAQLWSLWALRLVLPLLAIPAVINSPWGGAVLLVLWVGGVTAAAWGRESLIAVLPLMDRLPGPRTGTAKTATGSDG